MVPLKAVYFDLDDTLCAYWDASKRGLRMAFERHPVSGMSTEQMVNAWGAAFREFSPTVKDPKWYAIYCKGGSETRVQQMRHTLEHVGAPSDEHAELLSTAYGEERNRALKLFPDAVQVLDFLRARYPLGLITNGPADIQRQEIATLEIEDYFKFIFIEGELGFGKPLAQVFKKAEEVAEADPSELAFVGNSYAHDIRPALDRGWRTFWIRRDSDVAPSRNAPEHKPDDAPEPTATIYSLSELIPLLN